jgi:hypothetical protein
VAVPLVGVVDVPGRLVVGEAGEGVSLLDRLAVWPHSAASDPAEDVQQELPLAKVAVLLLPQLRLHRCLRVDRLPLHLDLLGSPGVHVGLGLLELLRPVRQHHVRDAACALHEPRRGPVDLLVHHLLFLFLF